MKWLWPAGTYVHLKSARYSRNERKIIGIIVDIEENDVRVHFISGYKTTQLLHKTNFFAICEVMK